MVQFRRGNPTPEYHDTDFSVYIERGFRELITVIYERGSAKHRFNAEFAWNVSAGIFMLMPAEITGGLQQIVRDLEVAFHAMNYTYEISRKIGIEMISENERVAAFAELRSMGLDAEVAPDKKQVRLKKLANVPPPDIETAKKQALRMRALLEAVRGERVQFEILAKSK